MTVSLAEPRTKRWTREEYYRLAQEGYFRGQRVQLIDGEIIQTSPQGHPHARAIVVITRWLHESFPQPYLIRIQMPLHALEDSDPEPDAAVVAGPIEKYADHPTTALLVIEISDASLQLDRRKALLYAAAGVREYWIVNFIDRCIEVHREPVKDPSAEFGARYTRVSVAKGDEALAPSEKPDVSILVKDLVY